MRRISFTGSPETARHIGVAAAKNIVPFTGELGGKGPLLVFEDCDLEAAARKAAGQFDDAGQVCLAGTRLLVQESVAEEFLELFHRFADEHVLGDPRADDTTVTPLIHRDHFDRVASFVERARANGDEIVRGGRPGRARRPLLRADARAAALERRARSCSARSSARCSRSRPSPTRTRASRSRTRPPTASRGSSTRARPSGPSASAAPCGPA